MKHMATIFALAASAILLVSCAEPQPAGIPTELREIMRAGREIAIPPPHQDLDAALQRYMTPNLSMETDARVAEIVRQNPANWNVFRQIGYRAVSGTTHLYALLSHDELADEIHFLLDLLRYGYGAYQYFGGDAVFLPLRDAMLARLAQMRNPLRVSDYLRQVLVPYLRTVIGDNHFQIHNVSLSARDYVAFMSDEFVLRRRGDDFVTEIDGATYRVLETALGCGTPVDGIMPTLTAQGEFAHAFGHLAAACDRGAWEFAVALESSATGETHSRVVNLAQLGRYIPVGWPQHGMQPPSAREADGVPVVTMRGLQSRGGIAAGELSQMGRDHRDSPVVVLDIRGIGGGNPAPGRSWIMGYLGGVLGPRQEVMFSSLRLQSATQTELGRSWHPGTAPWRGHQPSWSVLGFTPSRAFHSNRNLLIVLTDKGASSGGDIFVGYLRQLENALFVGTNTHGNYRSGGISRMVLPHSGLDIIFSTYMNLRPDLSLFEGVGFLPDLWVPPVESLDRVLAFVERYGLNR